MAAEWVTLTISHGPLLDEITAALRDAGMEVRTSPYAAMQPQTGVRTSFGQRHAADQYVEVRAADMERADAIMSVVFHEAEEAAYLASGATPPSQAERDEEEAWRAAELERRQRSDLRWKRGFQVFFLLLAVAVVGALVWDALH